MIHFPECCKNCEPPIRSVGCHGRCEKYIAAKEEHGRKVDQQRKSAQGYADTLVMLQEFRDKTRKRKNVRSEWKGGE